jgi:hypothetical protein
MVGGMRNAYENFVGKPEGKRKLGRPRCRWEDITEHFRKESLWTGLHLAQDRDQWRAVVNTVMKLWFPLKARNFLTS